MQLVHRPCCRVERMKAFVADGVSGGPIVLAHLDRSQTSSKVSPRSQKKGGLRGAAGSRAGEGRPRAPRGRRLNRQQVDDTKTPGHSASDSIPQVSHALGLPSDIACRSPCVRVARADRAYGTPSSADPACARTRSFRVRRSRAPRRVRSPAACDSGSRARARYREAVDGTPGRPFANPMRSLASSVALCNPSEHKGRGR